MHVANSSEIRELIEDTGKSWRLYMIEVGSMTAERICDALGRLKGPLFMGDVLAGVSERRRHRAPLGDFKLSKNL